MLRSRGGVSLPLARRSAPLFVILDRDNEEDQQGDALDTRQEEEVVVQRAVIDIPCKSQHKNVSMSKKDQKKKKTGI